MRRAGGHSAERMDELVRGRCRGVRAAAERAAARYAEVDRGEARPQVWQARRGLAADAASVSDRSLEVDEVLLRGGVERGTEIDHELREPTREALVEGRGIGQANERQVELAECCSVRRAAGERIGVEAERPSRIFAPPPGVHAREVGGDLRRRGREALRAVRGHRIDHVDLTSGDVRQPVGSADRAAPARRDGRLCRLGQRPTDCEPSGEEHEQQSEWPDSSVDGDTSPLTSQR